MHKTQKPVRTVGNTVEIYILLNISEILGGQRQLHPLHQKFWRDHPLLSPPKTLVLLPSKFTFHTFKPEDKQGHRLEHNPNQVN